MHAHTDRHTHTHLHTLPQYANKNDQEIYEHDRRGYEKSNDGHSALTESTALDAVSESAHARVHVSVYVRM